MRSGGNSYKSFLREPVIRQQRRACVRACARGYGGMPEVDLGDPACPFPEPTAKIEGGRAAVMQAGKQGCSAWAVQ